MIDYSRTSDKPHGPWPSNFEPLLACWLKLELLEYEGKPHESSIEFVGDRSELYHAFSLPLCLCS